MLSKESHTKSSSDLRYDTACKFLVLEAKCFTKVIARQIVFLPEAVWPPRTQNLIRLQLWKVICFYTWTNRRAVWNFDFCAMLLVSRRSLSYLVSPTWKNLFAYNLKGRWHVIVIKWLEVSKLLFLRWRPRETQDNYLTEKGQALQMGYWFSIR